MIAILSYGGYQVFLRALTVGGFVAFYSYLARLFGPLSAAVDIYSRLNRLNSSLRRIFEIIDEKPTVCESPAAVELPRRTSGGIILEGVVFGYHGNPPVLAGLKPEIRTTEKIGAVGVRGGRKSTNETLNASLPQLHNSDVVLAGVCSWCPT